MDPLTTLATNTVGLAVVLGSMAFRMKGKYLVHEISMIVMVAFTIFGAITSTISMDSSSMQVLFSPFSHLAVVSIHMFVSVATLIAGVWLVALWRPHSTEFAAKSKRPAQLTTILWVSTYVLGVLVFVTLHTTLFA